MWREPLHSYPDANKSAEDAPSIAARGAKRQRILPLAYAIVAVLILIAVLVIFL
jgi:hypothetical protein